MRQYYPCVHIWVSISGSVKLIFTVLIIDYLNYCNLFIYLRQLLSGTTCPSFTCVNTDFNLNIYKNVLYL